MSVLIDVYKSNELFEQRISDYEYLLDYIINRNRVKGSLMFSGQWGSGKTFLLRQVLSSKKVRSSSVVDIQQDDENPVLTEVFNAWDYDQYSNFLGSLLQWGVDVGFIEENKVSEIAASINLIGFGLSGRRVVEPSLVEIKSTKKIQELVLNQLLPENLEVLIIDDLDRARPEFAMMVLHTVKWLSKHIKVIVLMDEIQISQIIKHYYGTNYSSFDFMQRIFTDNYSITKIEIAELWIDLISFSIRPDLHEKYYWIDDTCLIFKLLNEKSIRSVERAYQWLKLTNSLNELNQLERNITVSVLDASKYFVYLVVKYFAYLFIFDRDVYYNYWIQRPEFPIDFERLRIYLSGRDFGVLNKSIANDVEFKRILTFVFSRQWQDYETLNGEKIRLDFSSLSPQSKKLSNLVPNWKTSERNV